MITEYVNICCGSSLKTGYGTDNDELLIGHKVSWFILLYIAIINSFINIPSFMINDGEV